MKAPLYQIDAFTDQALAGNPAAVVLLDDILDASEMQAIACEMNLSETAFPMPRSDGGWDLRWFTPTTEVDLCGHATLATAHVLFETSIVDAGDITFHTRSGPLTCSRVEGGIAMDFPTADVEECEPDATLAQALGTPVVAQARSFDLLAQVDDPQTVSDLRPDLATLAGIDTRAVIVTAAGDLDGGDAHFVSRVFAPRVGVAEDPVTGSAHTVLGPWWAQRLGTTSLRAHQVSARGGRMTVEVRGDRTVLTGRAVTVVAGALHI